MSLFFGDQDTLAPLAFLNNTMLFACPACGACVVEWEFSEANRRLHEEWHVKLDARIEQLRQMYGYVIDKFPIVTKTGKVLTDDDIQASADEAEAGYDVSHLRRIRTAEGEIWPRIEPPEVW